MTYTLPQFSIWIVLGIVALFALAAFVNWVENGPLYPKSQGGVPVAEWVRGLDKARRMVRNTCPMGWAAIDGYLQRLIDTAPGAYWQEVATTLRREFLLARGAA